jgi:hypothetical protein
MSHVLSRTVPLCLLAAVADHTALAAVETSADPSPDFTGFYTSATNAPPSLIAGAASAPVAAPSQARTGGAPPGVLTPSPDMERQFYPQGQDTRFNCIPNTAFGYNPYGEQLISTPGRLTWINQYNHLIRRIDIDQPRPKNIVPTYTGYSTGHWEGDTLVVVTTDFRSRVEARGIAAEATLSRIEERIKRVNDGKGIERTLHQVARLPDGKEVEATTRKDYVRQDGQKLTEFICEEGAFINAEVDAEP